MSDTIEKIYCCDRGNNNDGDNNWWPLAMMNGGMGNQWNNPFVYLVWMMFAQRNGWGGNWNNSDYGGYSAQVAALQNQMQDNHNSDLVLQGINGSTNAVRELSTNLNCDFNTLNAAICDVRGGIDRLSGQIGFSAERIINAGTLGNCNIIQALKDCCCETQKEILAQSNLLQRGQDFINRSIERGFSAVGFQAQQDKSDIIQAGNANTQRIIDTLNTHWKDEQALQIQDLKFQLSQERQNRLILSRCGNNCGGCGCDGNWSGF